MPAAVRSLAGDLRRRSDDEVQALLRLRPDLARPVPKSFSDLAVRANTVSSTLHALANLTAAHSDVLEAACALSGNGPFGLGEVCRGLGQPEGSGLVTGAADELFRRLLLWGSPDDVRVPSGVREVIGPTPCGLDPAPRIHVAAVGRAVADPSSLLTDLAAAGAPAAAAVERVAWGPPVIPPAADRAEAAAVAWLEQRELLIRDESEQLVLPREISLILRRGLLLAAPRLEPPSWDWTPNADLVARTSGHAADQSLRKLDRLAAFAADQPFSRQANGSIRAKQWEAAQAATGLGSGELALLLAVSWSLVWLDDDETGRLRPTTRYTAGTQQPRERRWADVVQTWLDLAILPSGEGESVLRARSDAGLPDTRRLILAAAAAAPPGRGDEWLQWSRPRRPVSTNMMAGTLAEARELGLVSAHGALPILSRLGGNETAAEEDFADQIRVVLPKLSRDLIIQADLTATALGPLPLETETRLSRVSVWESGGGASVFRFTPESVRRGLARGEDPTQLLSWLAGLSKTPLPQSLTVLVQDSARGGSRTSVVAATSVLRCDDAVAEALRNDPGMADAAMQQLAPGVHGCTLPPAELARRLVARGYPVDTPGGESAPLVPQRSPHRSAPDLPATPERIVRSLRRLEEKRHPEQHPPDVLSPIATHEVRSMLSSASQEHLRLWLRFSDDSGSPVTHLVELLSFTQGEICAFDVTSNEIRVIPVARVAAVLIP